MNRRYTLTLVGQFSRLYRGWYSSDPTSPMTYGFECGDGWFRSLYTLSQQIEAYCQQHPEAADLIAVQVKQKFGELRFHVCPLVPAVQQMIEHARVQSRQTCERTGKPGEMCRDPNGYYQTLCPEAATEFGFEPVRQKPSAEPET